MSFPNKDEMQHEAARRGKDQHSRRLLLMLGVVLTLSLVALAISAYLLWDKKQHQALAGKDLAVQVQHACTDAATAAHLGTLCVKAKQVEKEISAGPQGPPGTNGKDGVNGVDGVNGTNGLPGPAGANGKNGVNGTNGVNGHDGANGKDGAPGPAGENGKNGADGKDGANAYPMSWSFRFSPNPAQDYSFQCTLVDPSQQVNCVPQ